MRRKVASDAEIRQMKVEGLAHLRSFANRAWKVAELGGQGNDQSFQEAFSSVAHAYIQDKVPSLMDYEQGFQLLDRSDDDQRAAGVFGFRVGSQQLLVPVFFLNGQLRGHELMYLKNQNAFVPLKENWVDEVMSQKPGDLGSPTDRRPGTMGISTPDLTKIVQSPSKRASAQPMFLQKFATWSHPMITKIARVCGPNPETSIQRMLKFSNAFRSRISLPQFLKEADSRYAALFSKWCQQYPVFAKQADHFHGFEKVAAAACEGAKRRPPAAPKPLTLSRVKTARDFMDTDYRWKRAKRLKIVYREIAFGGDAHEDLTQSEREDLLKKDVLIQDDRPDSETSMPLRVDYGSKLRNPGESGRYNVLTHMAEFEDCLVFSNPLSHKGKTQFAVVVRHASPHDWVTAAPRRIWVTNSDEGFTAPGKGAAYDEWFKGLSEPGDLSEDRSAVYMMVGPQGQSTVPFSVSKSLGKDKAGIDSYRVYYSSECMYGVNGMYNDRSLSGTDQFDDVERGPSDGCAIHLHAKNGDSIRIDRDQLYVPRGFKVFKLSSSDDWGCSMEESKKPLIINGDLLHTGMYAQTKELEQKKADAGAAAMELLQNPQFKGEIAEVMRQYIGDPNPNVSPAVPSAGSGQITPPPPAGDPAAGGMPADPAAAGGDPMAAGGSPPPGDPGMGGAAPLPDPGMMAGGAAPPAATPGAGMPPDAGAAAAPTGAPAPPKMAFQLGDLKTVERFVTEKTAELKIYSDGYEVFINTDKPRSPVQALGCLVRDHGFREKIARELLRLAEFDRSFRCRVKYADQYGPYLGPGPSVPAPPEPQQQRDSLVPFNGPTTSTDVSNQVVPGLRAQDYDQSGYDLADAPPMWAQQAEQSKDQEGFDTAMIGSMLRAVNDSSMIDRYLPKIFQGMNAIGNMLLMFYWHQDAFSERFGKQDMPELEDSLRNNFEGNGDLYLFMKHKSAQPFDMQLDRGFDLANMA